jgi:RNA polymerase sigma-70 factor (ECF subfamily)
MDEHDWLAQQLETHRTHLRTVAYRMLGSTSEAVDALQEAWLQLSSYDTRAVQNFKGWLTTEGRRGCAAHR